MTNILRDRAKGQADGQDSFLSDRGWSVEKDARMVGCCELESCKLKFNVVRSQEYVISAINAPRSQICPYSYRCLFADVIFLVIA